MDWETMQPRERDAWIAEYVMEDLVALYTALGPQPFTTDAAADYLVLDKVRETWACGGFDGPYRHLFCAHLVVIWQDRQREGDNVVEMYRPGDYSHAAYLAVAAIDAA